jgi:hypothetical protein
MPQPICRVEVSTGNETAARFGGRVPVSGRRCLSIMPLPRRERQKRHVAPNTALPLGIHFILIIYVLFGLIAFEILLIELIPFRIIDLAD